MTSAKVGRPMEGSAGVADVETTMTTGPTEISDLFSRIPVALYRTDLEGNLLTANSALAALLGYESFEKAVGAIDSVYDVYADPNDRDRWLEDMARKGLVFDFDVKLKRSDGTTIWVQDTARAIEDESGEIIYYEGALIDVTEKVEAKKARDAFLAMVSHELRHPIAAVLGLGQELASGYETFADEDRREMVEMIARQAEDASWLIEDLLVAYRDEVGDVSISVQEFDLVEDLHRVFEVIDHDIELEVSDEVSGAVGDPRRTRQIVRNLLNNALYHGGEEIVVRVSRAGDLVEICVCDDGDEIDAEEAEQIFRAFRRGTRSNHPSSVGLGLPVARKLARLMDGDLIYRHDGGYSCFALSLPAA